MTTDTTGTDTGEDRCADCFFQGVNGLGERLPENIRFRPFYSFTFYVPITTAAEFSQILSWCNATLGERDEGRWEEDFNFWHLGDEMAAELFRAAWIVS